ncbi:methionyl-tRNA formyltransferase [Helicobacter valdiviensis]|uniref:Methionyl-tRNA formyltransferase n=1 Tax=Helicobacter valdiviensis TaxID=1458358 RepID=A0A2W6NMX4_9HELI|nr:formyltransferase family protein [Helicobacter valdiviensis]PZT48796.1 methionyl-tRNA formyltransferase [Helicobacter valdiviensis]
MKAIVIVTQKKWNIKNFYKLQNIFKNYNLCLITEQQNLTLQNLQKINPKYIFFPHWSYKIQPEIYNNFSCIVFHMSDLPYGRGGSPLQNLITRGIKHTKISALEVNDVLDGGDIYLKSDLDISKGSAKKIYKKASKIIFFDMISYIVKNNPTPTSQVGKIEIFKRRKREESNIITLTNKNLNSIYDFIRMLDAPTYPRAFIELDNFKIEFSNAKKNKKTISGRFKIYEK